MKIRRHMHPDQIPAVPKAHRGENLGGSKRRPTREKMGRKPDSRWGKVYNSEGYEIDPKAIQKLVEERTAMTASVALGKLTVLKHEDTKVTVDARDPKAIQVFSHGGNNSPYVTNVLKYARAEARLQLHPELY